PRRVDRIRLHRSRDHLLRIHPNRIRADDLHLALRRGSVEPVHTLPAVPLVHRHRLTRVRHQRYSLAIQTDRTDPPRPLQHAQRIANLHPVTHEVRRYRHRTAGHQRRTAAPRHRHTLAQRRQHRPPVPGHRPVVHGQLTVALAPSTHVHRPRTARGAAAHAALRIQVVQQRRRRIQLPVVERDRATATSTLAVPVRRITTLGLHTARPRQLTRFHPHRAARRTAEGIRPIAADHSVDLPSIRHDPHHSSTVALVVPPGSLLLGEIHAPKRLAGRPTVHAPLTHMAAARRHSLHHRTRIAHAQRIP